jgi:transcription antitermination factor NusG
VRRTVGFGSQCANQRQAPPQIAEAVGAGIAVAVVRRGEHVRVVEGAFRDFEAMFENYLSGSKRVAILMKNIEGCGVRVVASASAVARI